MAIIYSKKANSKQQFDDELLKMEGEMKVPSRN
jgi:hypothetical protein